ncbi:MAG: DUF1015 domain-containing protein [Actinomycetota bacterium]|nr:DUF1015 domain-containing protein [Actinomycetota bacterium]
MARFEPFTGLRYRKDIDLNQVTSPPYDVIADRERAMLAERTPYNAVHVDLPVEGADPYAEAARRLGRWQDEGVLVTDAEPSFYLYRTGWHEPSGQARQTTGVLGALALPDPDGGGSDVLPHEHTTPKAKSDRLALLRATGHNLSPIWALSLAEGLSELSEPNGPPVGRCTDEAGVHHRLWRVTSSALLDAVTSLVASAPVVIADGHHRYETSMAFRDERRAAGDGPGAADLTLALLVELTESELAVQAIHRLVRGLPEDFDLVAALEPFFEPLQLVAMDESLTQRMVEVGGLALVVSGGSAWLLRPREDAFPAGIPDLDSSRLDVARAALPAHEVVYQHGPGAVAERVDLGEFDAGFLLRPATVDQIAATARSRDRMPPKTTYFFPKPRTGFLFRSLLSDIGS